MNYPKLSNEVKQKLSDSDWLHNQYVEQSRSSIEIAISLNVCATTVRKALRKFCIKRIGSNTPEYKRAYKIKNPELFLVMWAKRRAKRFNVPFNITAADVTVPSHCPVLGIPLIVGQSSRSENSPSIDRVIPEQGYTKGNVEIISFRANMLKSNATLNELEKLYEYFRNRKENI